MLKRTECPVCGGPLSLERRKAGIITDSEECRQKRRAQMARFCGREYADRQKAKTKAKRVSLAASLLASDVLACLSCVHWVPTAGAELGGSCELGRFLVCKPYLPGAVALKPTGGAANVKALNTEPHQLQRRKGFGRPRSPPSGARRT